MCCTCIDVADQGGGDGLDGEGWMRSGGVKGSNSLLNINLFIFDQIIRLVKLETAVCCESMIAQLEPILDWDLWDFLPGAPRLLWLRMSEMIHWWKHLPTDWCWPNQIEGANILMCSRQTYFNVLLESGKEADRVKIPENCQFTQSLSHFFIFKLQKMGGSQSCQWF